MKRFFKESIYGERGRKWRSATETSWFKRNEDLIIVVCVIALLLLALNA